MSDITNPLDIIKRLDVKQNVTIRVIDEPTGKVVQEHIGHNAATNSLLTGIAHYLMGDGVLNQANDLLSSWVPQYISLGTMGLTSQDAEDYLPVGIGYTPAAPANATAVEKELNEQLRFEEYVNQAPGFGADGYDANSNNDREWFGLGYPYSDKPAKLSQDFYNKSAEYILSSDILTGDKDSIISVTVYPDGIINQDIHDTSVVRNVISVDDFNVALNDNNQYVVTISDTVTVPDGSRVAIIYVVDSDEAVNCELITSNTLRSKITYRNIIPEVQSEIPNTLDVIYSAFISTGALKDYRGPNDYVFITEAGLWSKSYYNNSGDNGLLAGYRIMPTDDEVLEFAAEDDFTGDGVTAAFELSQEALSINSVTVNDIPSTNYNLDTATNEIVFVADHIPQPGDKIHVVYVYKTTDSWKDMSKPENREAVKQNIIRIGKNQVAQVIWKLQLGGLEQLNGLRYLYPSQYPEEVWNVWTAT